MPEDVDVGGVHRAVVVEVAGESHHERLQHPQGGPIGLSWLSEIRRLDRKPVVSPPGACRPPGPTEPHVAVVGNVVQHVLDRFVPVLRRAVTDDPVGYPELTQKPPAIVRVQPIRERLQPL